MISRSIDRRRLLVASGAIALPMADGSVTAQSPEPGLDIVRAGSVPPRVGAPENFTGTVRIDTPFKGAPPSRVSGATVAFAPGARTAWHTHPLGQTLIVKSGVGWVQLEGQEKVAIRPSDVVFIPAGRKHWHGATASTGMAHIAFSEALDGKTVEWLEKVSDEQYGG